MTQTVQEYFEAHIQNIVDAENIESVQYFRKNGLPTTKNEEWKYTNLSEIANNSYNFYGPSKSHTFNLSFPELDSINFYFINGIFQESFSFKNPRIDGLTIEHILQASSSRKVEYDMETDDSLLILNSVTSHEGVYISIDNNTTIDLPIIIHNKIDAGFENVAAVVRNVIECGQNAECTIIELFESEGEKSCFSNIVTEINLQKDAKVNYYKIQNEGNNASHVGATHVLQKDKSNFYAATLTLNGGLVRNNLHVVLDGQHTESFLYGLYVPNAHQHVDNHTLVDHKQPNCESNELYKGILMDKSTGVFNGKIFVREDAQKTNAFQNCRNVLMSKDASMNTKPQLEIWADDVKCSHGTTTGQLNEEAIFYMQARGIPKHEAQKLQMLAFVQDVVSKIKIEAIRNKIEALIQDKIG